jgi:hypothetical protein
VGGFTAIKFIDLESVSYADDTSWQISNGKICRFQPVHQAGERFYGESNRKAPS